MSFIRPEAADALRRYGEPVLWGGVALWAGWRGWVLAGRGHWLGWLMIAIAVIAALGLFGAIERALVAWRSRTAGPGVVSIREGRIAYFGPAGGAVLALDALVSVEIATAPGGAGRDELVWHLTDEFGQHAAIPGGAAGAEALLDRLGSLPGFNHVAVVGAMRAPESRRVTVWRRSPQSTLLSR